MMRRAHTTVAAEVLLPRALSLPHILITNSNSPPFEVSLFLYVAFFPFHGVDEPESVLPGGLARTRAHPSPR